MKRYRASERAHKQAVFESLKYSGDEKTVDTFDKTNVLFDKKEEGETQSSVYIMSDRFLKEDKVLFLGYYKESETTWKQTHFQMCLPELFHNVGFHDDAEKMEIPLDIERVDTVPVERGDQTQLGNFQKIGEDTEYVQIGEDRFSFTEYLQGDLTKLKWRDEWTCVKRFTPSTVMFSTQDDLCVVLHDKTETEARNFTLFFAKHGFDSSFIVPSGTTHEFEVAVREDREPSRGGRFSFSPLTLFSKRTKPKFKY